MAKDVEHDPELIERLARLYAGNGRRHLKKIEEGSTDNFVGLPGGWTQDQMLAASSFAVSASYWSLISPERSLPLYRDAARLYRAMGHSYWMVPAIIGGIRSGLEDPAKTNEQALDLTPQRVAFELIANEMPNVERRDPERVDAEWRHLGNVPVGRLGIPLDHYGRCAHAMRMARQHSQVNKPDSEANRWRNRFFREGANYINRASEVIRAAKHDRYHWQSLRSSILPAEPEAVAMATAMSSISYSVLGTGVTEMPGIEEVSGRLILQVGDDMWRVSRRTEKE